MAGSLVLVDEYTVSGTPAAITIGGGSSGSSTYNYAIDSTYNVYMLIITGLTVSADDAPLMRVTKSGTAQDDSEYDFARRYMKADTSFATYGTDGATSVDCMATIESDDAAGGGYGIFYLFNFPAAGYSHVTYDDVHYQAGNDTVYSFAGGFTHTVASASDGLRIGVNNHASGSTLTGGNFKLYGITN